MDINTLWAQFVSTYGEIIIGVVALILADLVTGVAAALKLKKFNWQTLGNFYVTNVLPKLLIWIALNLVVSALTKLPMLDQWANVINPVTVAGSFLVVAGTLLNSIWMNAQEVMKNAPQQPGPA